ncbi:EF-P 5-aminopentanol modification-associated protein YfmH [Crassaminicella profunda]|uniref:EF-P 5-aminopentanol modification-associated protein YfmH n=1 Tax=Crassaminicella profunda TaxID=1286698 RepID=UPI001CA63899|nr:pitrilysin family protein [Crassaminicella profunda]QZY57194.1 insulinase family protein [Crassaminicella profunda]
MTVKTIESKLLKEKMILKELPNGLKVFFMPKEGYTKQYAIFATNYGSNESEFVIPGESEATKVPDGIAHFLEHKLFEEPEGSIFDKFSELGSNVNAYTNFTSTCYLFSSTDRFYENLEVLMNFVQSPYFTDENVEKEKGIIGQEIKMYEDNPNWKVFFNGLKAMYHHHPVRVDIAGTVESISKITKEDLYKCYNTFYDPSNMIVFIVGDVDQTKAFSIIEKLQKKQEKIEKGIERIYPEEPEEIVQNIIEEKLDVSIPLFNIAFKDVDNGLSPKELLKKDIGTKILLDMLFGKSSDLYKTLYEEGLINDTFENEYTGEKDYAYSMLGGESKNPKKVLEAVLSHIQKLKSIGLNKEDFERIKKKHIGQHLSYYNSVEFIATTFVSYYFKGINIFDYVEDLKNIEFETIQKRFKEHFHRERCVLSIISPKSFE